MGRAFAAVRDSEVAARSLGIDPARFKLTAFALSGVLAGLSGATLAYLSGVVKAAKFDVFFAISYLLYAVVGGVQSLGVVTCSLGSAELVSGGRLHARARVKRREQLRRVTSVLYEGTGHLDERKVYGP